MIFLVENGSFIFDFFLSLNGASSSSSSASVHHISSNIITTHITHTYWTTTCPPSTHWHHFSEEPSREKCRVKYGIGAF